MNIFQVIGDQARKLVDLLFNPDTGNTYKSAALLTWEILKESARLVWLLFCVVLIVVDWLWRYSFQAGQTTRNWYNAIEDPKADNFLPAAGRVLTDFGRNGASSLFSQAREQLGLPAAESVALELPTAPEPTKVATAPAPTAQKLTLEKEP